MHESSPPPPQFVAPPADPALEILQKQTESQNIDAMKQQSQLDTSHLMQQYGIMSALTGTPAPLTATPSPMVPISGASLAPGKVA